MAGLSSRLYDVVIVGAGPAGSHAAYELASSGYDVAVFEEKAAPGVNACCTGIISSECFRSLRLDTEVLLAQANSVKFFSPSGKCFRVQSSKVQAYVVDRRMLDKAMASKAQSRGAHYLFSARVLDIAPDTDRMQVEASCAGAREIFNARSVILANGLRPKLSQKLGMGRIRGFMVGAQVEIDTKGIDEPEVHFGREIVPGSFAWVVPVSANRAYVGVLTKSQAKLRLRKFLDTLCSRGRMTSRDVEIRQKAIPLGTLDRSYGDRVLAIGDAAGQVKPTTGGGIYFGHIGARIAAQVLGDALSSGDLTAGSLSRYESGWKAKMGKELSRGYWLRRACARLTDRQIERVLDVFSSSGMAQALLNSDNFSFDWHSELLLTGLKHSSMYPLLKIKQLLSREANL